MYATRFTDNMILSHMTHRPKIPASIADDVGCSTMTILRALPHLEDERRVERIVIESKNGRLITGWSRGHRQ